MFLLRCYKRNSNVMTVCYVCYDITRNKIFDLKWKPYAMLAIETHRKGLRSCRNPLAEPAEMKRRVFSVMTAQARWFSATWR
jgi:hypothetical protein